MVTVPMMGLAVMASAQFALDSVAAFRCGARIQGGFSRILIRFCHMRMSTWYFARSSGASSGKTWATLLPRAGTCPNLRANPQSPAPALHHHCSRSSLRRESRAPNPYHQSCSPMVQLLPRQRLLLPERVLSTRLRTPLLRHSAGRFTVEASGYNTDRGSRSPTHWRTCLHGHDHVRLHDAPFLSRPRG